jgi:hypothetical protein
MEQARYREEHEGEKYLDLLGLGYLADQEFVGRDGGTHKYRDFLDHCGPDARNALAGLAAIGSQDPRYEATREALLGSILQHIESPGN